jgi:pimeloyl-ACP methyl ester carboxylesterase
MVQAIANGLRINYEDLGHGEPALLLMSAWCMSHAGFAQLPIKCAKNRRVLALDWRGHGQSESPIDDFGADDLLEDALAVIKASGVQQVIPVTLSHSGWIAVELRRKLGERIPKLVHLDWLVLPAPPAYMEFMKGLTTPDKWQQTRDQLFKIWLQDVDNTDVIDFIQGEMGSYSSETWMRSGREISASYVKWGSPLEALNSLDPHVPVLHLYAQPKDPEFLTAQKSFANSHSWFHVKNLEAKSHFPTFEVPDNIASEIENFIS